MARLATSSGASSRLTRGSGCPACRGTGYRGRVGIFELLVATDEIRDAIAARAPRSALRAIAGQQGMLTLQEDGWRKVLDGVTTPEEVLRAVQD
jgi:type II secretory ATPase GspE/PulE/Tfp pilus assembly ATPase PilB-like protein